MACRLDKLEGDVRLRRGLLSNCSRRTSFGNRSDSIVGFAEGTDRGRLRDPIAKRYAAKLTCKLCRTATFADRGCCPDPVRSDWCETPQVAQSIRLHQNGCCFSAVCSGWS